MKFVVIVLIFNCFAMMTSKPVQEIADDSKSVLQRHVRQCPFGGGGGYGGQGGPGAGGFNPFGAAGGQQPGGGFNPTGQQPDNNLPFRMG